MPPLNPSRAPEILLVEDNENDVLLTREAFDRSKWGVILHRVENGDECMEFLTKKGNYAEAKTPDLILLDLNMPGMNGREVLEEMYKDDALCRIPVVVLTTSCSEKDVVDLYKMRCSSYVIKPVDFTEFQRTIQGLADYWFTVVVLPPAG